MRKDTFKHQGMRRQLVGLLVEKGITDQRVLDAIGKVPRHLFMDSSFEQYAYQDKPFPIGCDQTISQPYTVAFQSQLLEVKAGEKVLEVGTGSGYQAAVLCEMGAKVYSIERMKELFNNSSQILRRLGYSLTQSFGDGYKGMPAYAPFDKIIVTAGAPELPKDLLSQLKIGGRMVIPYGSGVQEMYLIERTSETDFTRKKMGKFRFVPMLKNKESRD
ncbi:MAG: protein-L-isoaspartate(D-aspartate) O-methyltransferase [Bacteroidota bacterium]|nr:protein-L-isoaspartate(D-aspartate) O-methyltransferase [Bacteroidota bacterium]MDX5449016.1 protein-L-isoaspartate(D-aspartate) O-methyltransferase [Bacteroidota bacterium]MDX5506000.1 protein-L-isoaspartate(D-aspartate) O-methyltransferase [Bacteroidota bacterium]